MAEHVEFERFGRWRALDMKPKHSSPMSNVWRVRDEADPSGPVHALKIMKRPKSPTSSAYVRFVREADTLARLGGRHPAIMPLLDRGEEPGEAGGLRVYLVMPYYSTSLDRAAKGLTGNVEYAISKLIDVADALEVAHADGIIHRDVKPANVLLDGDDQRVVLGDFGICLLDDEERFTHTESGTLGTPYFVAPELVGGGQIEHVSPTVDVYSLGKTLYAVLVGGTLVFPASRHRDERYDLVRRFEDARLAHVHGALDLLCAEDPSERLQSITEARALLERLGEAIRENVPYREGLYRGGPAAEWRALRLRASLERTTAGTTLRRDAVREAFEAVVAEVEVLARDSRPGTQPAAAAKGFQLPTTYLRAVDEVLGLVLPLLRAEDEGLEDAQATLLRWLAPRADGMRANAFLQAASSLALHSLAATAWRLHRGETLSWCIQHLTARYETLVYLDAFDGRSDLTTRAIEQALRKSSVISRLVPEVRDPARLPESVDSLDGDDEPPASLLCVAGLVAMRATWFGPVADIARQLEPGGEPPMLDWPAFQGRYRRWVELLPDQLLRLPRWERVVAGVLGAPDVRGLRRYWAKHGPVLARLYARRNRGGYGWAREFPSPSWRTWVESA